LSLIWTIWSQSTRVYQSRCSLWSHPTSSKARLSGKLWLITRRQWIGWTVKRVSQSKMIWSLRGRLTTILSSNFTSFKTKSCKCKERTNTTTWNHLQPWWRNLCKRLVIPHIPVRNNYSLRRQQWLMKRRWERSQLNNQESLKVATAMSHFWQRVPSLEQLVQIHLWIDQLPRATQALNPSLPGWWTFRRSTTWAN